MLVKLEIMVLVLIGIYTIISIVGAAVNLKRTDDLKRRVNRVERSHAEMKGLVYEMLWNGMEERTSFEPMEEEETCGSISLEKLQG